MKRGRRAKRIIEADLVVIDEVAMLARGVFEAVDTYNAKGISFVAREDIEGRALMVFYPIRPLSWLTRNEWPDRGGFVR